MPVVATDEEHLADELASLRLDRAPKVRERDGAPERRKSGALGWLVAIVAVVALAVGGFYVYREGSGRIFSEEVELGAVTLMSPAQADVTLVATGYVYARKQGDRRAQDHRAAGAPATSTKATWSRRTS